MKTINKYPLAILLLLLSLSAQGQADKDYPAIFGRDYKKAVSYLNSHAALIDSVCAVENIRPELMKAVVFPELIRYNSLSNLIETTALELLYVDKGPECVDFSIGHFQMKPSFAETVEQHCNAMGIPNVLNHFSAEPADTTGRRSERLNRLTELVWQVHYVCSFMKAVEHKLPEMAEMDLLMQLRVYATAYNSGFHYSLAKLQERFALRHFPSGPGAGDNQYVYSDISVYYYKAIHP